MMYLFLTNHCQALLTSSRKIMARKARLASILRKSRSAVRRNLTPGASRGPLSSSTPARWGWKVSSRSAWARVTAQADHRDRLNSKNPAAPAVSREAEEELGQATLIKNRSPELGAARRGLAVCHSFNTASQSCSGSRSPAFACSMIFRAITSLAISPRSASRSAMSAISYARPMTRIVSGVEPLAIEVG